MVVLFGSTKDFVFWDHQKCFALLFVTAIGIAPLSELYLYIAHDSLVPDVLIFDVLTWLWTNNKLHKTKYSADQTGTSRASNRIHHD